MREERFFRYKNNILRKNPLKLERNQCSQQMRKYPFLAPKTSKSTDFSMDLCCKVAELDEFNKTWIICLVTYYR